MRVVLSILIFLALSQVALKADEKPALIVLTDIGGDTDDEQSFVRLLLYSDKLDIKSICITSRLGHGQDIKPEIAFKQLNAYKEVYPNLKLHSEGFPAPEYLISIVKKGQGDQFKFGTGFETEASNHIIDVVDKTLQTVHIAVWGGLRELAQALWNIKETRSQDEVAAFSKKIQVHAIGNQDRHRDWIIENFKDVKFIASSFVFLGEFGIRELATFRGMYMTGDVTLQDGNWVRQHIHGHGTLSDLYQLHGHGTDGMKEGDTPSFLGLIANGLNVPEKPEWGGWGGRFRLLDRNLYIDAQDFLDGTLNERHSVARWRPAFQRDFMARVKWCKEPFEKANHNPVVVVNGQPGYEPLFLETKTGSKLLFDASESYDPDGGHLSFNWFVYNEIYNPDNVKVKIFPKGKRCSLTIPKNHSGKAIHLIIEVVDNGIPALTSYKRIIII
ncbi:MAG: hypothetical protein FD181_812 [Prolixibacteraceae bacterium]|nr:MAG: hypothetical protein FD181_812 [Prolixibacteraceae bacterium]